MSKKINYYKEVFLNLLFVLGLSKICYWQKVSDVSERDIQTKETKGGGAY